MAPLYTIGFTKKTARTFFEQLRKAGVKKLVDVRLNNQSQLSGFSKRDDLRYFCEVICGASYAHMPDLAPTQPLLDEYKKRRGNWADYERQFNQLMSDRGSIEHFDRKMLDEPICLLCSEDKPLHCHRRLVADAMKRRWPDLEVIHL